MKAHQFVLEPTIKVCIKRDREKFRAFACVETPAGPIYFCASASIRMIERGIRRAMQKMAKEGQPVQTGSFLSGISSIARKIARARVLSRVLDAAKEVTRDPIIARAVGLTTLAVPGLGTAVMAYRAASDLLDRAKSGDMVAKGSLQKLTKMAALNSPAAAKSLQVLRLVSKHRQALTLLGGGAGALPGVLGAAPGVAALLGGRGGAKGALPMLAELAPALQQVAPNLPGPFGAALRTAPAVSQLASLFPRISGEAPGSVANHDGFEQVRRGCAACAHTGAAPYLTNPYAE